MHESNPHTQFNTMKIPRRTFIARGSGMALGAIGLVGLKRFGWSISTNGATPHPEFPEPAGPDLMAAEPAVLPAEDRETLRQLADTLADKWQLPELAKLDFDLFVNLKTESAPSYLVEYRSAADLFRRDPKLAPLLGSALPPESRVGHAHAFVVMEFLQLIMMRGGFRALGYANYPGNPGGPFGYRQ